ncbi:MAG: hypothetical protein UX85_C0010G0022 [Candidatus Beckwithbacteria bacterium GW2011_GWB1_47_15]|uniref:BioF2-like acetyltransferase domain-containing protein n=1 Tax=Candidatus Beckwithbacteria bacterium GW2011_GWB1_47_15 TaxID=1618371 RepID=A0A0G1RT27_9BACT|nr:MAG: putative cellulose biosynthesis protein CelD [Candidatus Beckwithbacteria bacterium GW2011_GWC1_49_16]AQS30937.1 hypothetical protein [uncultured bacterium]KKU34895.1 MAG: hypothetical protein UX50_C0009G0022 [Candidatus Beckwithbacteria bacterium GW2011_GWA1_46_30]KKU60489.1 MAG: hypothetical protein UX85_C0010G0022 [Candidatus Beckwithbacteria bacterium GW2011_GWB1_47_15]KKU72364.1 MAG: hypothetical protein UX97_C0001G0234 [Candidatus Beckwithbacteria bacterium GW2011_GWA2_47_25]OGD4
MEPAKSNLEPPGIRPQSGAFLLDQLKLSPQFSRFYRTNGNARALKNLTVEVVSDLGTCQALWQEFSPQKTLFDTWEFRLAFYRGYHHQPYFLTLKSNEQTVAVLPLWYEAEKKKYFWFGSWWQEESKLLVKDPIFIPLLLAAAPSPLHLNAIAADALNAPGQLFELASDDPKYVLDLTDITSLDDFLARLKKKRRYNLRRDKRIIEAQNPQIIFDRFGDFKHLVALSQERFRQKGEDTDWEDPRRVAAFRHVIALGKKSVSYQVRMVSVKIGGRIAGVDLIALYQNCYFPVKCGYDVARFPGIGNYFNLLEIEDALNLGMKKMDFLEIDYGWKHKWFTEVPLYVYEK